MSDRRPLNRLAVWCAAACFFAAGYALTNDRLSVGIFAFVAGYLNLALADGPTYDPK